MANKNFQKLRICQKLQKRKCCQKLQNAEMPEIVECRNARKRKCLIPLVILKEVAANKSMLRMVLLSCLLSSLVLWFNSDAGNMHLEPEPCCFKTLIIFRCRCLFGNLKVFFFYSIIQYVL